MPFDLHKKTMARQIEYNFKRQGNNLGTPSRTLLKTSGGTNTLNPTNIQGSNFLPPPLGFSQAHFARICHVLHIFVHLIECLK
jgi:hypothetical protein